ncbi:MAG TPA: hypothetical protein DCP92_05800 [Nitrospiraceae bacterium]|nr:hypothetical protein [Nitrospiraceae bacterium]
MIPHGNKIGLTRRVIIMAVVLVVDDDPLWGITLTDILSKEGYETHVASSSKQTLRAAKTLEPNSPDRAMDGQDE